MTSGEDTIVPEYGPQLQSVTGASIEFYGHRAVGCKEVHTGLEVRLEADVADIAHSVVSVQRMNETRG